MKKGSVWNMRINRLRFVKSQMNIWYLQINDKELVVKNRKHRLTDEEAERVNKKLLAYIGMSIKIADVKEQVKALVLKEKGVD